MTAKQRVVLGALRDAQHQLDGEVVSAGQVAAACPARWNGRPHLVTQALWLLHAQGFVLVAAGSTRVEDHRRRAADARTAPRPARQRPVIGRRHHHP